MALNKEVFKTRALTALVFVAVMLVGLLWNFGSFLILLSIIHIGCWFEYLNIIEKIGKIEIDKVIKYFLIICGFTLFIVLGIHHWGADLYRTFFDVKISYKVLFWLLLFSCLLVFIFQNKVINTKSKILILLGFIYITISLASFLYIKDHFTHTLYSDDEYFNKALSILPPIVIILSIWINDTMAYLVGSFIGKTLFSKISPKKTWEGTIGGAILCVVVIALLGYYLPIANVLPVKHWVAIAIICAVFGTLGDLLESKLKRTAGIKDSGSFMPGHGGFLDRFDSLLIAAPIVWFYFQFFVW
jgi:phosphatidate cytidylyltransferase